MLKKLLSAVFVVLLVLGLGVGVTAAPKFNVTVMPFANFATFESLIFDYPLGQISTEVGIPVSDRLELVTGADYVGWNDNLGSDSIIILNLGARYSLGADDRLKPFLFGNYGTAIFSDGLSGEDSESLLKFGIGAVAPINDRWGVVAQIGLNSYFEKDADTGNRSTERATFSSVGLRFNF